MLVFDSEEAESAWIPQLILVFEVLTPIMKEFVFPELFGYFPLTCISEDSPNNFHSLHVKIAEHSFYHRFGTHEEIPLIPYLLILVLLFEVLLVKDAFVCEEERF